MIIFSCALIFLGLENLLSQHIFVKTIESFVCEQEDHTILGIRGSCDAKYATAFIRVLISRDLIVVWLVILIAYLQEIIHEFTRVAVEPVTASELSRAKKLLKHNILMQSESRQEVCQSFARQFARPASGTLPPLSARGLTSLRRRI